MRTTYSRQYSSYLNKTESFVDFTKLNDCVQRERHMLLSVEQTLAQLVGRKNLTIPDANSSFYWIHFSKESAELILTTFITPFGRFYYNRITSALVSVLLEMVLVIGSAWHPTTVHSALILICNAFLSYIRQSFCTKSFWFEMFKFTKKFKIIYQVFRFCKASVRSYWQNVDRPPIKVFSPMSLCTQQSFFWRQDFS